MWQEQVSFEVVDQYLLDIEVYNQSVTGKDVLLGFTQLSLLSIYRTGNRATLLFLPASLPHHAIACCEYKYNNRSLGVLVLAQAEEGQRR